MLLSQAVEKNRFGMILGFPSARDFVRYMVQGFCLGPENFRKIPMTII